MTDPIMSPASLAIESGREAASDSPPSRPPISLEMIHGQLTRLIDLVEGLHQTDYQPPSASRRPHLVEQITIPDPLIPTAPSLAEHWTALGVSATPKPTGLSTDGLWDVAKYLGDHYSTLATWYQIVKRATQQGQLARLGVHEEDRQTIETICRFNRLLYNFGLATESKYLKYPERRFLLTPNSHPHTLPFLLGGWLEDYVAHQLTVATGTHGAVRNLLVQATAGHQVELDLVWYQPPLFLVLECKTHDYQASLPRLQLISRYLRPTHLFVVVLQRPSPEVCQQFAQAYGIRLLPLQEVPRTLSQLTQSNQDQKGACPA